VAIGLLLAWFGGSWIVKAVKRQAAHTRAGWVTNPLAKIGAETEGHASFSKLNFLVMTKSAALEGLEAAIVIVTLGLASGSWLEAGLGAAIALLATIALVAALHGHFKRLPEVLIKLGAGILLTSFGIFWIGEGAGVPWPLGDGVIAGLVALLAVGAGGAIRMRRRRLAAKVLP
jgi:uncharacterized membrane protein